MKAAIGCFSLLLKILAAAAKYLLLYALLSHSSLNKDPSAWVAYWSYLAFSFTGTFLTCASEFHTGVVRGWEASRRQHEAAQAMAAYEASTNAH